MNTINIPVLALRGMTAFPGETVSFDVEREISIFALDNAMEGDRRLFLVTQRKIGVSEPEEQDLYEIGTVCHVLQIIKTSETTVRVLVEGEQRARLHRLWQASPFLQANVELLEDAPYRSTSHTEALLRQTYAIFGAYKELSPQMSDEVVAQVLDQRDPGRLADFIAQNLTLRHQDRQRVLDQLHPVKRLQLVNDILTHEVDVMGLEFEMEQKVRQRVAQVQKDMILREQLKVLQHELGEDGDEELSDYEARITALHLPEELHRKLMKEVDWLAKQPFGSAEGSVIRNYLDVCLELPWGKYTRDRADVAQARRILDRDHFGLEQVKERILEFVAVRQLSPNSKGKILCLVGPPGVGKTSIALSVSKALHRKMARLSLGGVRDEADIRGHRKTYIGAMPGRIIDAISRSGSMNPLLVLDEIDKLGSDMRGDPASALLEVLDSEQNYAFRDHYLEIPVDLSQVLFITTANTTSTIPRPLLDRMEVIELTSYTDEEKLQIAKRYLLPRQMKEHGLKKTQLRLSDDAIRQIISGYTRESGVRLLERQLGKVCRKTAMRLVDGGEKRVDVTPDSLRELLGVVRYQDGVHSTRNQVGVVNGLAWTEVGGEILEVEAGVMEGSGKLELTGNLGTVMQESVRAALTCLRSRCGELGIEKDFYKTRDIHVHFPEGAVPKDGPSAGIAITTAMLSALTGRKVRGDVAMTGEVTLRGRVLPIGGLKEKTMAALRSGIRTVILPKDNVKDLEEIDQTVRAALHFVPVESVDQVFAAALVPSPTVSAVEHMTACPWNRLPRPCGSEAVREGGHHDHQLQQGGVRAVRHHPKRLYPGRSAPGDLCRPLQRGQVLRHQPAAEPEELRTGGRYPRQDLSGELFPHRRQALLYRPARLRLCQGQQGGAGSLGPPDGELLSGAGAYLAGRAHRRRPAQALCGRRDHVQLVQGGGLPHAGGGQQGGQAEKAGSRAKSGGHPPDAGASPRHAAGPLLRREGRRQDGGAVPAEPVLRLSMFRIPLSFPAGGYPYPTTGCRTRPQGAVPGHGVPSPAERFRYGICFRCGGKFSSNIV